MMVMMLKSISSSGLDTTLIRRVLLVVWYQTGLTRSVEESKYQQTKAIKKKDLCIHLRVSPSHVTGQNQRRLFVVSFLGSHFLVVRQATRINQYVKNLY